MHINKYKQYLSIFLGISLLTAYIASIEILSYRHQETLRAEAQERARDILATLRFKLEARVLSDLYIVKGLSTLVTANPQAVSNSWNSIAQRLMSQSEDIQSLALAPNDVVRFIYPYRPNKKALGKDFRSAPEQWAMVKKAKNIKEVYLAGPINLIQGDVGFVVCAPIFLDPPSNQFYWGSLNVVLDINKVISVIELRRLEKEYNVAIRGIDAQGKDGDIFYGNVRSFIAPIAQELVNLPYGNWVIVLSPKGSVLHAVPWYRTQVVRLVGYLLSILVVLAFSVMYRLYRRSRWLSLYDELTQLPNRRYFMWLFETQYNLRKTNKVKDGMTLVSIDLNDFKHINDHYGHLAGDAVLAETAKRLKQSVRPNDFVARMGGDEFLILVFGLTEHEQIIDVVSRIHRGLSDEPVRFEERDIVIRASIGYTMFDKKFSDSEEMMNDADHNMYEAKQTKGM